MNPKEFLENQVQTLSGTAPSHLGYVMKFGYWLKT